MKINVGLLESSLGSSEDVGEYLRALQTDKVMFLNGPESPGPCLRCLALHRTIYRRADAGRPRPPMHPNCYCRVVSYRPTSQQVQRSRRYEPGEYLSREIHRVSMRRRQLLLGQGRARLHRLGIIRSEDLVSRSEGAISLERHLRRRLRINRQQFNRMTDRELIDRFNQLQRG